MRIPSDPLCRSTLSRTRGNVDYHPLHKHLPLAFTLAANSAPSHLRLHQSRGLAIRNNLNVQPILPPVTTDTNLTKPLIYLQLPGLEYEEPTHCLR